MSREQEIVDRLYVIDDQIDSVMGDAVSRLMALSREQRLLVQEAQRDFRMKVRTKEQHQFPRISRLSGISKYTEVERTSA